MSRITGMQGGAGALPCAAMPGPPTDLGTGLTAAEVQARTAQGLGNRPPASPAKSVGRIVREDVCTFFNLVFLLLAAALVAVGSFANLGFLLVAVCNTGIGIYQRLRARAAVEKLTLMAARPVRCLRDGRWQKVGAAALVQGDIVEFAAGDQICADAVVRAGSAAVNEALISGEADPVPRRAGEALRSGSFVAAGRCAAQLTDVGAAAYANRLAQAAKADAGPAPSEMVAALDKLIRAIGIVLVPVGAVLFAKQFFWLRLPLRDATEATVAALIGMIPEGLYLLTSVALAVSVRRLAKQRVLVQDMRCIETLARVDVLCLDKTGTITEPGMDAGTPVLLDAAAWGQARVAAVLGAWYARRRPENETGAALAYRFAGAAPAAGAGDWAVRGEVPFSTEYKWSAVTFAGPGSFVLGAPEAVAGARYAELAPVLEPLLQAGTRVLLLAAYDGTPDPAAGLAGARLHFLALLPVTARIRAQAPPVFAWFAAQGVQVKVISGDNPVSASQVARQAGIPGAQAYVDASALDGPDAVAAAAGNTVFGRVTPEQKRELIRALQAQGHTVAMVGDGVNDVLALKEADCGIAMAGGAQAASKIARLVLLDSDFTALPAIVAEGRRVINNIQRSATLFLVKNIFSFLLSFVTLAAPLSYPLEPLQLSLVGAVTIGIPAFVLALEPSCTPVRGAFLRNVAAAALPGGVTDFLLLLGVQLVALVLDLERGEVSTVCTAVLLAVGLCVLWRLCEPFDRRRRLLWGAMAALGVCGAVAMRPLLGLAVLDGAGLAVLAVFAALAMPALDAASRLQKRAFHH